MKFITKIVLILFVLFLSIPTIVATLDESVDTSFFFNTGEEETQVAFEEIKFMPSVYSIPLSVDFEGLQKVQFSVYDDRKVSSISPNIFLPPPELI